MNSFKEWMIKISDYLFSQDFNINRKLLREYDNFITQLIKLTSGFCKDLFRKICQKQLKLDFTVST